MGDLLLNFQILFLLKLFYRLILLKALIKLKVVIVHLGQDEKLWEKLLLNFWIISDENLGAVTATGKQITIASSWDSHLWEGVHTGMGERMV